ncbi:acyl-CoA synthetase [Neolewinella lacunae]|uniref:AMP-binding protein n=1 Tax=Neolewinella lacunae TaxID=1517758 RepID=A0A923PHE0_9BACT|nr:acyl-CoA synthetase [Neolewinella lacunae]MBC6994110.1 AMP-binding protein [Neolewinella lacunae]MDN3636741.1 acyl-CoA synthetase [Neolewinella lacunae]
MIQLVERAHAFATRTAIKSEGQDYSYAQLLAASESVARKLLNGEPDLNGARIAFLVPAGFAYAAIQWGIWRAGGVAVPLCEKHPLPSIEYVLTDTQASTVVFSADYAALLNPLFSNPAFVFLPAEELGQEKGPLPEVDPTRNALILYTSGTTGAPKGVVTTHANIEAQITALTTSWEWHPDDHALNVLPLHHVHGIINVLSCALWSGACCEFLPKFREAGVFELFRRGEVNVFMAVPTIYFKLIAYYHTLSAKEQEAISTALVKFRLMVSGSAALPVSVLEQWKAISGHTLLERYGMTEMGMAISNPYHGTRRPGHIGQPLPGVEVRLADENDQPLTATGQPGEIQIKGANVFKEYWGKPEETSKTFTPDGWFRTGDVAVLNEDSYQILGRNSIDIIKSGGYKISAIEIEEVLRNHPGVKDCAVVGIPDDEWGEVIGASIVPAAADLDLPALKAWMNEQLPGYKTPRKYLLQEDLPRNVMGKVTKQAIKDLFVNSSGHL